VDASRLRQPGGTGDDWRLHLAYDFTAGRMGQVLVTDQHTGEHLAHYTLRAGDVVVADNGYGYRGMVAVAVRQQADVVLRAYPPDISSRSLPTERLLEANRDFRAIKHVLAEAETLVREMEQGLLAEGAHAARYVTKLRQDLTNDVNYILVKVNGRISDAVNGIRV